VTWWERLFYFGGIGFFGWWAAYAVWRENLAEWLDVIRRGLGI
jgi:hypothetical protein